MLGILKTLINISQIVLLHSSYYVFYFFVKNKKKYDWVVGVDEIAKYLYSLSQTLPNTYSVCFSKSKFYDLKYNFSLKIKNRKLMHVAKLFFGPILLGYLTNRSDKFIYIWSMGFLFDRNTDFKFLKSKNKKLVCMFMGSDIRSPILMLEYLKRHDIHGYIDFLPETQNPQLIESYDRKKKSIARSADKHADIIFNMPVDQISYLQQHQHPLPYMYDEKLFFYNKEKFIDLKKPKILHAPSNPLIKGTPLVRAAIKKLKLEGYHFDYVELHNSSNEMVLHHLKTSQIVLNQFYVFVPGVFGIEAMANHCALLTSADRAYEPALPESSKSAWIITKYWNIYDKLKYLLENPEQIEVYAENGYQYAKKYCTYQATQEYLNSVFEKHNLLC
jgi:hypothetical protein